MAGMRGGPGAMAGIGIPGHRKRATAGFYGIPCGLLCGQDVRSRVWLSTESKNFHTERRVIVLNTGI